LTILKELFSKEDKKMIILEIEDTDSEIIKNYAERFLLKLENNV
jgi:hypothetical protein